MNKAMRIALTVLIAWTFLHLVIWIAEGCHFLGKEGFWPFYAPVRHLVVLSASGSTETTVQPSPSYSFLPEFLVYVGTPWLAFACWQVLPALAAWWHRLDPPRTAQ